MLVVACIDVDTRAMQDIAGPSYFKGATINTKMRRDHELLSSPEVRILKWLGYITKFDLLKMLNCTFLFHFSLVYSLLL
ncbi:hypothetical protein [Pseudoalteromonas sp. NBT06-2]|uniref:hypothetical protein n=1 Tax=Pseudoalteromonas sp. NBT06-2 TaxID=2025950 RepID=UPI00148362BE|nr:hypothetical protein [Pseudoalteromonas sp. NBT06-2]